MTVRTTDPQQTQIITNNDLTASKSAPSKLRKGAKSKYIVEEHPIVDGIGKVVRTRHTGDTYHCFFYVKDEQKWMRKSLHTKRLAEALEAGRKLIFQTLAKIDIGERVFAKTYKDVIDEHLEWKQKRADGKFITQGRVTTIRSTLKWAAKFAGGETKTINSKDGTEWSEYYVWRKSQKPDVKDATLVNERSMISELFKFADQKRYVTKRNIPIFDNTISKHKNVERRDAFNQREYNHLCNILQHFDKHAKNPKDRDYRKFIKDFFLISANTGIRFGEMRRLKWNQINILSKTDADGKPMCEIRLDIADTKNKKARIVQGMRGDFFSRIKEYSKFTRQSDYVFNDNESEDGAQLPKEVYYSLWKDLLKRAELHERDKLTWYSLRHTYATFRLLNGLSVFVLAKNLGTSVKFIEEHYGHVETAQMRDEIAFKKPKINEK